MQQTTPIDFGATQAYSKYFVNGYLRIVWALANRDEDSLMEKCYRMGFLMGDKSKDMLCGCTDLVALPSENPFGPK
jgi:predicted unusual protein kinase regulating ubiquinone biosynthesis (AarF/ABC1/UbiB family)